MLGESLSMALLKIILGTFFTILLCWFSIKFFGENQQFAPYDHPLIHDVGPWVMAYGGESSDYPSHTMVAIDAASEDPKTWLALDISMSADRSFYAIPYGYRAKGDNRPWPKWTDSEIEGIDAGENFKSIEGTFPYKGLDLKFSKLEAIIAKHPDAKYFLWFRDNEIDLDLIIASFLKKFPKLDENALIFSDFDVVMKSLKKQLPRWVYGSAAGERTRFLMFEAVQLQSAATLNGDFYFTALKTGSVKMISEDIKRELDRRKLPLVLGPLSNDAEISAAIQLSPKGFITNNSSHLNKILLERK